jgi:hypothetical protein
LSETTLTSSETAPASQSTTPLPTSSVGRQRIADERPTPITTTVIVERGPQVPGTQQPSAVPAASAPTPPPSLPAPPSLAPPPLVTTPTRPDPSVPASSPPQTPRTPSIGQPVQNAGRTPAVAHPPASASLLPTQRTPEQRDRLPSSTAQVNTTAAAAPVAPPLLERPSSAPPRQAAPVASPLLERPSSAPPRQAAPVASPVAVRNGIDTRMEQTNQPILESTRQAADMRPTEGHIYLEGAVLGRWLSDQLSRAAARPQTSSTAFDPRVSPVWPGSPIGN